MLGWLKRQADILTSLSILAGAISAIILMFGGTIPPWYTTAQAREDQQQSVSIQKATVDTLSKLNDKIDNVAKRLDGEDCSRLSEQLSKANAALLKNPADPVALALRESTTAQARMITGCLP